MQSPGFPPGTHLEVCAMRYRPTTRSRRVRAYVHPSPDLMALAVVVRSWLFLRGAV